MGGRTVCEDTLFHGETLLVVSTGNFEDVAFPLVAQGIGLHFRSHAFFIENADLVLVHHFEKLLATRCRVRHVELDT